MEEIVLPASEVNVSVILKESFSVSLLVGVDLPDVEAVCEIHFYCVGERLDSSDKFIFFIGVF